MLACGVSPDHLREIRALPRFGSENRDVIKEEMEYKGLSVIIALRECIHVAGRKK